MTPKFLYALTIAFANITFAHYELVSAIALKFLYTFVLKENFSLGPEGTFVLMILLSIFMHISIFMLLDLVLVLKCAFALKVLDWSFSWLPDFLAKLQCRRMTMLCMTLCHYRAFATCDILYYNVVRLILVIQIFNR